MLKTRELVLSEKRLSSRDTVNVIDLNGNPLGAFAAKLLAVGGRQYKLYDVTDENTDLLTVKEKALAVRATCTFFRGETKG